MPIGDNPGPLGNVCREVSVQTLCQRTSIYRHAHFTHHIRLWDLDSRTKRSEYVSGTLNHHLDARYHVNRIYMSRNLDHICDMHACWKTGGAGGSTRVQSVTIRIYCILSKNSSPSLARNIHHLVAVRIGMIKMAEGDEYLGYLEETLERVAKPLSALLGVFLEMKWWVLNSPYGHQFKAPTIGEEFVYYQGRVNELNRHAVAVYEDEDSNDILQRLPREFSWVLSGELEWCDEY